MESQGPLEIDHVNQYQKALFTINLFIRNINDAIKEGDGPRLISTYKFVMLYFKATGHSKYAYSATKLLYRIRLQPEHAFKLIWCRFINTRGISGRNISLDLHMEHINKFLKELLKGLRSNMNEENADRVAKTVKHMMAIVENVENNHDINVNKSKHLQPNTFEDVKKLALA